MHLFVGVRTWAALWTHNCLAMYEFVACMFGMHCMFCVCCEMCEIGEYCAVLH